LDLFSNAQEYLMDILLDISKWLGSSIINNILPMSFKKFIEPGSDLSTALGAFMIAAVIALVAFLI